MKEYESMDAKRSEEPPVRHRSIGRTSGNHDGSDTHCDALDPPKVLSRIPDVPVTESEDDGVRLPPSNDRPVWTARLSSGFLLGGAMILLSAALFTFNRKGASDSVESSGTPRTEKTGDLEADAPSATMARKWIGGTERSDGYQTLSRTPAFAPTGDTSVPTLNGTAGPDRHGPEQPRTAAWGGQPQWPIAGDASQEASWNRSPEARTGSDRSLSSPWPTTPQMTAATESASSWRNQPVAATSGNLPPENNAWRTVSKAGNHAPSPSVHTAHTADRLE